MPPATTRDAARGVHATLVPGQKFGTRYRITKVLGVGGMGAVYQAWDEELGVEIALKVIRPDVTRDPVAFHELERRFKRELLIARQVTHKHVVRIHDLGEVDGIRYITMPYLEGEDLAAILRKSRKLDVPAALRIIRQVASGLQAAHEAGVVHRDLKPANIMVVDDQAIIMDFGIARLGSSAASAPNASLTAHVSALQALDQTRAGAVVGTVKYMAPEQALGETVDVRADIYAVGLILRDMLLGGRQRPESIEPLDDLRVRVEGPLPGARSVDPQIPEGVDRLISRCIMRNPAARYQTTAELVADLDRLNDIGEPLPAVRRVTPRLIGAAAVLMIATLAGTYVVTRRAVAPPEDHEPVSVVIADFENRTNDPAFDRTLEPMLKRALEGAAFISAYDRSGINGTFGTRPPEKLDEVAARELAVKQGLGVVLSGSIDREANGYRISVKAIQTVTGNVIAGAEGRASTKDGVMAAATRVAARVRNALGDDTSDSAQMFAMASLSTTSLEVLRHYATAREASSNGRFDEAQRSYSNAVELDPKFGIGYQALASVSQNMGNLQDAEKYIKEALRYLDGMTERERYTTRGTFYKMTGDYQQCVKEYSDLSARYPSEVLARNNLALCSTLLRDMPRALDEMRRVVQILPNRALFRINLALYASYAGDFQAGEREAGTVQELGNRQWGLFSLALAQLGQGQLPQAAETYHELAKINALGASQAASGLGDLAMVEGRFSDAVRILEQGAAQDLKSRNSDRAAAKFAALAYAELLRGRQRAAVAAIEKALANSKAVKIRFLAARSLVEAGDIDRARPLITGLASDLQAEPQAYAKIVEGELALKNGDARQAVKVLSEANTLLDTWIGHVVLGQAYLQAGAFTQADSEFDRSLKRRGEALALFLDEEPTYAYFPLVYYYQGRVREALNSAGFAESYRAYLRIRGQSNEDPLLPEVRRRAGM